MNCISCNGETAVLDKRDSIDNVTRRRRKCLECGFRFTTRETADEVKVPTPKVIKNKPGPKPKPKIEPKGKPLSPEKQNLIALFKTKVK
jgi:hypothetical protein